MTVSIEKWFLDRPMIEVDHDKKTITWLSPTRRDVIPPIDREAYLLWNFNGYTETNPSSLKDNNNDSWEKKSRVPF